MLQQIFLCFTGFCAGVIVAGGVSGLLIGLSIVPRYAGITHTADHIFLYEDMSLLGTISGTRILRNLSGRLDPGSCGDCQGFSRICQTPEIHPGAFPCHHFHRSRQNAWLTALLCHGLDVSFHLFIILRKDLSLCEISMKKIMRIM